MILLEDILELHLNSIQDFGGSLGVRDLHLLESAIARPFQTFDGKDLYHTTIEKAAALGESLIINHPFVDGNKRTGFAAMYSFLIHHKIRVIADSNDMYQFIISISTGSFNFEQIVEWLKKNTTNITT
jgi:death-on-curing protein